MAYTVRNTFLHLHANTEDDNSSSPLIGRSSSAPPACRFRADSADINDASPPVSTDISADNSDESAKVGSSTDGEHEEQSGTDQSSMTAGVNNSGPTQNAEPAFEHAKGPGAVQKELEVMSKAVMDIWTALSALEATCTPEQQPSTPSPSMSAKAASAFGNAGAEQRETQSSKQEQTIQPVATPRTRNRARSSCLEPSLESLQELKSVLGTARHALMTSPSVLDTELTLAAVGTIATLCIQMLPNSPESAYVSVAAIAKAELLEAAAASESVYVLGYEAKPFEDDVGKGFSTTLAIAPRSWECTACWETYQKGVCPRGKKCKWQHPGRDGIQPVRVLFC